MSFKLLLDQEFKKRLDTRCVLNKYTNKCDWQETIPEDTLYCSGCDYRDWSELAHFFFGDQQCGYCYHLGKGDFSYVGRTELLWDDCKECGLGEDLCFEDDEWEAHNNSSHIPNEETLKAMQDAEDGVNLMECETIEEMFKKLEIEDD